VSQWTGTFESGAIGVPMKVGPVKALTRALRGAFQLKGRSSRSEYWWFQLWLAVWLLAMLAVDGWNDLGGWVFLLAVLVVLPASISLCVRRLHDAGYSGWWYWIQLLPFVGGFWLFILLIQPSQRLRNRFGAGPEDHTLL